MRRRFRAMACMAVVVLAVVSCTSSVRVEALTCEGLETPLGIDNVQPHLGWRLNGGGAGVFQTAYQVLVASEKELLSEERADLWNSHKVASAKQAWVSYEGKPLEARSMAWWKVRVWDEQGRVTGWSEPAHFSVGLLEQSHWTAVFIGLRSENEPPRSPLFHKSFQWDGKPGARTFIHVNSLGYHEVYLNNRRVTDAVLMPAVSQYDKRSLVVTYDLSSLLVEGENHLVIWTGQGWYHDGLPGVQPGGPFVRAQMETQQPGGQWTTVLKTDASWQAVESGYTSTWRKYRLGGEVVDGAMLLRDFTAQTLDGVQWGAACEADIPAHRATPQMVEPNRVKQTLHPATVTAEGDTAWVYDLKTNFTGWTEIAFPPLQKGQRVQINYCDFLDDKGAFVMNDNYDVYIASGIEGERFSNKFNYHAYRYLRIANVTTPPALQDVTARLIRTDYGGGSTFESSDSELNQIHQMVQHTLQCLSLGGDLVDCPQVERLGYGGDGNASTLTMQTMYNVAPLYLNWMLAWDDCQRPDGGMPHTAPNPFSAGGGPFWCGFIITASWQTYVNYGDPRLLERFYPAMLKWLDYAQRFTRDGLLQRWEDTPYRNWYLGDWATPEGIDQQDEASVGVVNNCFMMQCYRTMAKIARATGRGGDAAQFDTKADSLGKLIHATYYDAAQAGYATGTQIDLTYPMLVGATPAELLPTVTATLKDQTASRFKGHLSAGLVGVPIVTEWAVKNRQAEWMYGMLKKHEYPGYLYMIDHGATTTWEHWDGQRSHIHNCYNGIGSWFYQALGGIIPDEEQPGYKHVFIMPQPVGALDWVKTEKDTPLGRIAVSWKKTGSTFDMEVVLPPGCTATVLPPLNPREVTVDRRGISSTGEGIELGSGSHLVSCKL